MFFFFVILAAVVLIYTARTNGTSITRFVNICYMLGKATTATHGDAQMLVYARHDDTQLLLLSCARTAALMKTASVLVDVMMTTIIIKIPVTRHHIASHIQNIG